MVNPELELSKTTKELEALARLSKTRDELYQAHKSIRRGDVPIIPRIISAAVENAYEYLTVELACRMTDLKEAKS